MMTGTPTSAQGFSLLELLVAVSILALAAIPILVNQSQSVRMASHVQEKVLAHTVAENMVALLSVKADVSTGVLSGEQRQGGTVFLWQADISRTTDSGPLMMSVSVSRPESAIKLAHLTGFREAGQ